MGSVNPGYYRLRGQKVFSNFLKFCMLFRDPIECVRIWKSMDREDEIKFDIVDCNVDVSHVIVCKLCTCVHNLQTIT